MLHCLSHPKTLMLNPNPSPVGRIPLEVLARLLVAYGLPVALQLSQVHVKGGAPVRKIGLQGHYAQRWLWPAISLLRHGGLSVFTRASMIPPQVCGLSHVCMQTYVRVQTSD